MPFSSRNGKDFTVEVVEALYRQNGERLAILDLGAGSGTYPRLFAQSALERARCEWWGVEVWEPYVDRFGLRALYDTLLVADIRDHAGALAPLSQRRFDLAIVGDVLEHIEVAEATALFRWLAGFCAQLLLSIPIKHYPQGEVDGNPYERHVVDDWTHAKVLAWLDGEVRGDGAPCWTCADCRCYRDVGVYVLTNARAAPAALSSSASA